MSDVPHLRFPEFSGEWEECSIQDFGEVVTGNTPPTSHAEYYENGSYLWASPADLGINKNITEMTYSILQENIEYLERKGHSVAAASFELLEQLKKALQEK